MCEGELRDRIETTLREGYVRYAGAESPERIMRRLYDDLLGKITNEREYAQLTHFFFPGGYNRDVFDCVMIQFWEFVRLCGDAAPEAPYYWGYERIGKYAGRSLFPEEVEVWRGADLA